jgi:Lrp/AsnC family transcriptional regulator, leucine-responsive regulatory protein
MLDHIDLKILEILKENSRMSWKDIGSRVHLTGQAVGNRIRRLEDLEIIEDYSITVNQEKLGRPVTAFITVFVQTANHEAFRSFYESEDAISEAYRISGEGCYLLMAHLTSTEELNQLFNRLLEHGNYRVNISLGKVKPLSRK